MDERVITAECGTKLAVGDDAYNYYDMQPGRIATAPDDQGWFWFEQGDGDRALLNGARICSMSFAADRGFPGA